MGQFWAQSVRRRRRLERITFVVLMVTIPVVAMAQISPTAASAAPGANNSSVYVVVRGDSLSSIARRNNTTVSALAQANRISNVNFVRVGARLVIPSSSTTTSIAVVSAKLPKNLQSRPDRLAYAQYFDKWADANGIPRDLLKSVCYMESGWNNSAVSSTGARGIGQLLPSTASFVKIQLIGHPELDINNPEHNIRMSARYLWYLMKLSGGNQQRAVAAYYQGLSSIQKNGIRPDTNTYTQTIFAMRSSFS
jgi:soluble lytic murein transglycosylase-like protein